MPTSTDKHFAIRFTGEDGVARFFVATATAVYPVAAALPADASAALQATVATLENLLGAGNVAAITGDGQTPEGQLIEGQLIEGQMIG